MLDAPFTQGTWSPENANGKYSGPMSMREALVWSKNMVSIRVLKRIGIDYSVNFISQFGFEKKRLGRDLSLALGSYEFTPLEVARGYAAFANLGYLVNPYYITHITLGDKKLYQAAPVAATEDKKALNDGEKPAPRVISTANAWLMNSMMHDVTTRGTGARTNSLARTDLAGKTGTTNDVKDAWFAGYNPKLVTITWLGYDNPRTLGANESGSSLAVPMWIDYMGKALSGKKMAFWEKPTGLTTAKVNKNTGDMAGAFTEDDDTQYEVFISKHLPTRTDDSGADVADEIAAEEDEGTRVAGPRSEPRTVPSDAGDDVVPPPSVEPSRGGPRLRPVDDGVDDLF